MTQKEFVNMLIKQKESRNKEREIFMYDEWKRSLFDEEISIMYFEVLVKRVHDKEEFYELVSRHINEDYIEEKYNPFNEEKWKRPEEESIEEKK